MDQRSSSPPIAAQPNKFSLAALCSPVNSPRVGTPSASAASPERRPSEPSIQAAAAAAAATTNGHSNNIASLIHPADPVPAPARVVIELEPRDDDEKDIDDGLSLATPAISGSDGPPEAQAEDGEDAEDDDDDDDDDQEDGDEEDDDEDEEDDDDEDDEEDDDDDDDNSSTLSRDLDEEEPADSSKPVDVALDGDTAMADGDGQAATATAESAAANGDAAAADSAVPKKRKVLKRQNRDPSVDVSLPKAPPPLPTMRLQLKTTKRDYSINVPELLHKELKAKNDPWATWYEERRDAGPSSKRLDDIRAPVEGEGLGDLGPFAHLLRKYPAEAEGSGEGPPTKKRRRRRKDLEEYDVNDPFVDDSELQIDEPTHAAKPLSKGFYVAVGEVELETLQKKGRGGLASKANGAGSLTANGAAAGGSGTGKAGGSGGINQMPPSYLIQGTQLEVSNMMIHLRADQKQAFTEPSMRPEDLPSDAMGLQNAGSAGSRDSPIEVRDEASGAKKKFYPTKPVNRRLAAEFEYLRRLVAAESFQVKSRFPPNLRDPLKKAARMALELGEYNENFFNFLPNIFPYNRFTMSKLVKRDFFEEHVALLQQKQEELLEDLREAIAEAVPTHRAEYAETLRLWREGATQAPSRGLTPPGVDSMAAAGSPAKDVSAATQTVATPDISQTPTPVPTPVNGATAASTNDAVTSPPPPPRKWRWTERQREDVFQLIVLENGISDLRIEKIKLDNSQEVLSELNMRKACYKRIVDLWPSFSEEGPGASIAPGGGEGGPWMTTTNISKEFGIQKKKHERQNNAVEAERAMSNQQS